MGDHDRNDLLSGIRVLDLTQYLSGPCCTRMMAELGADVIKVELAPGGDPARGLPAIRNGRSAYFVQQNRGKRSLCVDFGDPAALDLIRDLARHVDVVVENFGPGVVERKGLTYDVLAADRPDLIVVSITGFGREGCRSDKVAFDLVGQAYAGLMHMTGDPDGPPYFVSAAIADQTTGLHAFAAISTALFARSRTGRGQHIELSLVDSLYWMHEVNVQAASVDGSDPVRAGRDHPAVSPAGTYRGPEGWIVVLCLERQWPGLCEALGRPDLLTDPDFATPAARVANRPALNALIEAWMATFRTDAEVLEILDRCRVPNSPVLTPKATLTDPYFVERGMVRTISDPIVGDFAAPGFPFRFTGRPDGVDTNPELWAPLLGQHNAEVLTEVLGLDEATVRALEERGVLQHADH